MRLKLIFCWFLLYCLAFGAMNLNSAFNNRFSINFLLVFLIFFFFSFGFWPAVFLAWLSGFAFDLLTLNSYHFWQFPLAIVFGLLLSHFFNLKYFNSRLLTSGLMIIFYYLVLFISRFFYGPVFWPYFSRSLILTLVFDSLMIWLLNKRKNEALSR